MTTFQRPALGQVAGLGSLYDARTDNFVSLSLLKGSIPESAISRTQNHNTQFDYSESDSFQEKFSKMDVNAELRASFLCGLVKVEGSGVYLNESRDTNRVMQASLHYKITTVHEALGLMNTDLHKLIAFEKITRGVATHVVTEVTWGASTVITAKHQLAKRHAETEAKIGGALKAKLTSLIEIEGKGGFEEGTEDKGSEYQFDVRVNGDVLADNGALPTTIESAYDFIKRASLIPSLYK
jgi:hypothetical protein